MREIKALLAGFGFAFRGIGYAIRTQRNLRIHLVALIVVLAAGRIAELSTTHWCTVLLCCMAVISLELVNTAIEAACNAVTLEQHPEICHAKDAAAGAVLVSAIGSVAVAVMLLQAKEYRNHLVEFLSDPVHCVACLLFLGAASLFVFLPSILQKKK